MIKKEWSAWHYWICDERYFVKLRSFLNGPRRYLKTHGLIKLSNAKPATIYKLRFNTIGFTIKRYNYRGLFYWFTHIFRMSRAEKSWYAAELFEKYNIPTPKPIALYVHHFFGLQLCNYYVCELIDGETLKDYIDRTHDLDMIEKARKLIHRMHHYRITHGDLKATNIIVKNGELFFIDLDACKRRLVRFAYHQRKDLWRFEKNWKDLEHRPVSAD